MFRGNVAYSLQELLIFLVPSSVKVLIFRPKLQLYASLRVPSRQRMNAREGEREKEIEEGDMKVLLPSSSSPIAFAEEFQYAILQQQSLFHESVIKCCRWHVLSYSFSVTIRSFPIAREGVNRVIPWQGRM